MRTQKFHAGDLVQVADNLGSEMSHFTGGCRAVVIGSYADQYGSDNTHSYTLHLEGQGQCSWYEEGQLTLIEAGAHELVKQWKDELHKKLAMQSNRDWIFEHAKEVIERGIGASIDSLGADLGCANMWGRNGEGITLYSNRMVAIRLATPFLKSGDKTGWLEFCEHFKKPQLPATNASNSADTRLM